MLSVDSHKVVFKLWYSFSLKVDTALLTSYHPCCVGWFLYQSLFSGYLEQNTQHVHSSLFMRWFYRCYISALIYLSSLKVGPSIFSKKLLLTEVVNREVCSMSELLSVFFLAENNLELR